MTLEEAKQLKYHQTVIGRGNIKWRVNGKIKLWARSPERLRIPVKNELFKHSYIDETNLSCYHLPVEKIVGSD